MAKSVIDYLVHRILVDPDFRERFARDRESVLSSLELTTTERSKMHHLDIDELIDAARHFAAISAVDHFHDGRYS